MSESLSTTDTSHTTVKTEHAVPTLATIIKNEPNPDEQGHNSFYGGPRATVTVKMRTSHEVIEILSDSEDEPEQPVHAKEELDERSTTSFFATTKGRKNEKEKQFENSNGEEQTRIPFDPSMFTEESGTIWTDSDLTSFALEGPFQVTKELRVDRVEYLTDIPNVWPIPKLPTAFILDLRDDKKYLVRKKPGDNDLRVRTPSTPDFLIKNKASTAFLLPDIFFLK
jgi:hypothetical protein